MHLHRKFQIKRVLLQVVTALQSAGPESATAATIEGASETALARLRLASECHNQVGAVSWQR